MQNTVHIVELRVELVFLNLLYHRNLIRFYGNIFASCELKIGTSII